MKKSELLLALVTVCTLFICCNDKRPGNPRILVFSKTNGFRHSSIPIGKTAILKLGAENGFDVDTTEDASWLNEDSLQKYAAVVFLNTTDTRDSLLTNYEQNAFERYIQAGGGFVGVHAATDAGYQWGWYTRLVGAHFNGHPQLQEAILQVTDHSHPSTAHLPDQWKRKDEWYNFKQISKDIKVLMTIDEKSYTGGTNGDNHPMAWYHEYDGGRAFYTETGHTDESYTEDNFLKHLLGGIQYAIGENKNPDYSKVHTPRIPDEERFTKTTLKTGEFTEPTEMTILPNLDIIIVQRRGEIMFYNHADSSLTQAGSLNVYYKTDTAKKVNAEEGLMGVQADPDFAKNHFVYLFYSPKDTSVNRLSRFTFTGNKIDSSSEKIVLQFYSKREICCHTGGSIAFGKDRLLYLSTGDNTTPFREAGQKFTNNGFAPLDARPGHESYDARRTASNSNDLRGKILRIQMKEDGSYTIPAGNLFSAGQENTRPEIFVMGNRNPYRISIDKMNGFLYWGEVGPDSEKDTSTMGSMGYDEINQARKAGYFGWPLFVGNNSPYVEYDYSTGISGKLFDTAKPVNNSPNNTGIKELPQPMPAFIYYPYAFSDQFPQTGSGGRNAMAGPVYYTSLYDTATGYPEYYNGKLFIYDWIRSWIKVVTLQPNGDFDKMEPFMPTVKLDAPIDMELGPDGKIYLLEYGKGWFSKNPDAALSRIDYNKGAISTKRSALSKGVHPATDSAAFGHKESDPVLMGKNIIESSDCKTCHKENDKSIGPSFVAVAKKYGTDKNDYLAGKIIKGGGGVWGETAMPAHPSLSLKDAGMIVEYIQSMVK